MLFRFLPSTVCCLLSTSLWAAPLRVVTTTEDLAAITREIGGKQVDVSFIVKGFQNPHYIEPKPSYMRLLRKTDLLVKVGLDLEVAWLPLLLEGAHNPQIIAGAKGHLDASLDCDILEKPTTRLDRSKGDIHVYGNPHYWLNPENGLKIAENIAKKLSELDPEHSQEFQRNLETFKKSLLEKTKNWKDRMRPFKGTKIVSYHNSWPNFARAFDIQIVGFVEPKPGIPPSPSHLAELIDLMRSQNIKVIIMEPYFDVRVPEYVASRAKGKVVLLTPSVGGAEGIASYLDLFEHNLRQLEYAFKAMPQSSKGSSPWFLEK